jgi:hypothetical protein
VDLAALGALAGRVGLDGVPLAVARCEGFSYPSKLVEVEIDGVAVPAAQGLRSR